MLEAPYKNKGLVNSCFIQYLKMLIKPYKFQSFWSVGSISLTLITKNLHAWPSRPTKPKYKTKPKRDPVPGTRKCSQRYEIDHFCPGFFPAIQSCEIPFEIPFGILVKFSFGIHLEILFDIPFEVPCGLPLELSLEISLELPFEIPLQTPLELFLEIQFEIPFEIHFYIPFEKTHFR